MEFRKQEAGSCLWSIWAGFDRSWRVAPATHSVLWPHLSAGETTSGDMRPLFPSTTRSRGSQRQPQTHHFNSNLSHRTVNMWRRAMTTTPAVDDRLPTHSVEDSRTDFVPLLPSKASVLNLPFPCPRYWPWPLSQDQLSFDIYQLCLSIA